MQANTFSTSCLSSLQSSASAPSYCFSKEVFTLINSTCEYQSNCSLIVTTNQLGDPCYGYSKQLMVQYQCVDLTSAILINQCPLNTNTSTACTAQTDPSILISIWCEPSIMSIKCPSPNLIQIVCAYYGIDSSYQCPGGFYYGAPTSCYSASSGKKVFTRCNGKSSCEILGNPNFQVSGFADPCNGFSKILYVQYRCISSSALAATTTSTTTSSQFNSQQVPSASLSLVENNILPFGSCNSIASTPYVPVFLNNQSLTSFEYLINQQIGCLGSTIYLLCPAKSVIHIYSAYFGIQSTSSAPVCFIKSVQQPTQCYYTQSFDYINSTCEYQQSCTIFADPEILGDACPAYSQKELLIQYQCVDSDILSSTINQCTTDLSPPFVCPTLNSTDIQQQIWCDGDTMNITCQNSKNINVLCAFYGLHPTLNTTCGISLLSPNIPVCFFHSSFTFIQTLCSNNTSCLLENFANYFTDPCDGQTKALLVQWQCV